MEHSWECIAELLRGGHTEDILCDVGMPIIHRGVLAALFSKDCAVCCVFVCATLLDVR